jgi:DNA polymerase-1
MAFDVETTSTDPLQAELVGMSFSWAPETGWYLPFRAPPEEPTLGRDELEAVAAVLADATVTKTGHNLKYDALVMRGVGAELAGIRFDSMLASHLLSGHLRGHSLDAVAERALGLQTVHIDEVIGKGKKQVRMDEVPLATVCRYACEDADVALRLEQKLQEDLAADADLQELFTELELPLSGVLTEMQHTGVRLDQPALARMSEQMEVQLERLTEEIYYLAGRSFNIGSPKQLAEVLFDELEFPVKRRTKTGRSTDERVLEELALESHPKQSLPRRVLEYRMYSKLKSTYIDALPAMVNPATGRIHTTFHQTGTVTGRLSSSNPNLQNIPVRTEEGRGIRAAFIPEPGWRLVAADYSQIELRVLAHLSGDPELQRAFHEGRDIHQAVAAIVFDVEEADVEPQQRRAAKAINFGIVYGQTAFGLARTTGMSRGEAQEFIDDYFTHFRGVETFLEKTIEQAHRDGFVRTLFRRRREIPDLASSNKTKVQQAERMAVNTTVQGTAADLIKRAMVALRRRLADEGLAARLLLQIHDELLLECPPEETDRLTGLLREEMEGAMELDVPLTVDLGTGGNWLEAK